MPEYEQNKLTENQALIARRLSTKPSFFCMPMGTGKTATSIFSAFLRNKSLREKFDRPGCGVVIFVTQSNRIKDQINSATIAGLNRGLVFPPEGSSSDVKKGIFKFVKEHVSDDCNIVIFISYQSYYRVNLDDKWVGELNKALGVTFIIDEVHNHIKDGLKTSKVMNVTRRIFANAKPPMHFCGVSASLDDTTPLGRALQTRTPQDEKARRIYARIVMALEPDRVKDLIDDTDLFEHHARAEEEKGLMDVVIKQGVDNILFDISSAMICSNGAENETLKRDLKFSGYPTCMSSKVCVDIVTPDGDVRDTISLAFFASMLSKSCLEGGALTKASAMERRKKPISLQKEGKKLLNDTLFRVFETETFRQLKEFCNNLPEAAWYMSPSGEKFKSWHVVGVCCAYGCVSSLLMDRLKSEKGDCRVAKVYDLRNAGEKIKVLSTVEGEVRNWRFQDEAANSSIIVVLLSPQLLEGHNGMHIFGSIFCVGFASEVKVEQGKGRMNRPAPENCDLPTDQKHFYNITYDAFDELAIMRNKAIESNMQLDDELDGPFNFCKHPSYGTFKKAVSDPDEYEKLVNDIVETEKLVIVESEDVEDETGQEGGIDGDSPAEGDRSTSESDAGPSRVREMDTELLGPDANHGANVVASPEEDDPNCPQLLASSDDGVEKENHVDNVLMNLVNQIQ